MIPSVGSTVEALMCHHRCSRSEESCNSRHLCCIYARMVRRLNKMIETEKADKVKAIAELREAATESRKQCVSMREVLWKEWEEKREMMINTLVQAVWYERDCRPDSKLVNYIVPEAIEANIKQCFEATKRVQSALVNLTEVEENGVQDKVAKLSGPFVGIRKTGDNTFTLVTVVHHHQDIQREWSEFAGFQFRISSTQSPPGSLPSLQLDARFTGTKKFSVCFGKTTVTTGASTDATSITAPQPVQSGPIRGRGKSVYKKILPLSTPALNVPGDTHIFLIVEVKA